MKVSDIIRKSSDYEMAQIIGSVVAMHTDGITAEQAMKIEYSKTQKVLQTEMETEYVPTNADRIRAMSDEELAMTMMCPNENGLAEIDCDKSDSRNCYECLLKWLQEKVEDEHVENISD